jgi:Xaa-Pro aminopeptidase
MFAWLTKPGCRQRIAENTRTPHATDAMADRIGSVNATGENLHTAVADAIIAAVRPGVTLGDIQRVADVAIPPDERPYMQTGSFFSHHLGLSTGDPVLTDEPLQAGMVFTVEPWYYNHDRGISVFVEDMMLVTPDGAEVLSGALPRDPDALEAAAARGR